MKKLISVLSICLVVGLTSVQAQSKVDKAGHEVKEGAKTVGHKTAEVASKGKSKITDQTYKDKVGPNDETIYIDRHNKYYWVDDKGHRHYVTESELKNKVD